MGAENKLKPSANSSNNRKRKRYLPQNKPVKKKGQYPLRPGVQGFFITCDGGREHQASNEAINVIDSFYEELLDGTDSGFKPSVLPSEPLNKKTKFSYSDEEEDDGDSNADEVDHDDDKQEDISNTRKVVNANDESAANETSDPHIENDACHENQKEQKSKNDKEDDEYHLNEATVQKEPPAKSIDKLIEDELKELGDRSKRRFVSLDSGCNGVIFIQMHKGDKDPSPKDIVQHMMTSAASTRKHMSRFILRVLPVELTCYASEDEITRGIKPLIEQNFPVETQTPHKFAVLYEARANTGIDRMKIINSVAKSVPQPHKVDLSNPDKTIIVQVVKTLCLIGIVEKYKELSKYNLRQLTSPKA